MIKKLYVAGGCFWGIQEFFSRIRGVLKSRTGYINSKVNNPSYELVCSGSTDAAEGVVVEFDDAIITIETLIDQLFSIIDPTLRNRQGNDIGSQYRTGLYYLDETQKNIMLAKVNELGKHYAKPIVTEVKSLTNFFEAEEYHQDYLKKNPNGYCHIKLN